MNPYENNWPNSMKLKDVSKNRSYIETTI